MQPGDVLVAEMTDPDWEPVMKRVAAIVTDKGGRTAHAAIVSRELGLPCIVGTGNATGALRDGERGDGLLRRRLRRARLCRLASRSRSSDSKLRACRETRTPVMLNVGDPGQAFSARRDPELRRRPGAHRVHHHESHRHPSDGARALSEAQATRMPRRRSALRCRAMKTRASSSFAGLSEGIGRIAAAFYPKPVIVRTSDFKTNEYARLLGGREFEPDRREPDARFPRRIALLRPALRRRLRARMRGAAACAAARWE